MEDQLGARAGINNTDELQQRLIAIRDSITETQLHQYFRGMNSKEGRMQRVIQLKGDNIGK